MVSSGRKTRWYARYSTLLYFPFLFCLIGRCSRRWSPGAEDPQSPLRRRVPPLARSSSVDPRQEASPFRSVPLMLFVLAFLRQNSTNYVCTQILCLYDLCIRVRATPFIVIYLGYPFEIGRASCRER